MTEQSKLVNISSDSGSFLFQGIFLVKKLFSVLNFLAASVLRRKIPFEDSTEIFTPNLAMSLKSTTPSKTGGKVNVGYANFNLPSGNDMFRQAKPGLTSVNQKVHFWI